MPFRIPGFFALFGLGLAASHAAPAIDLTAYSANQAHAAAAACLQETPTRCGEVLQRYLDAAARQLEDRREPQTSQELRLRTTQSRLRGTARTLRQRAIEDVAVEPQAQAEALEQVVLAIDDLLSSARSRGRSVPAPALTAAPVQVVELLPSAAPARPPASAPPAGMIPPPSPPQSVALPDLPTAWNLDTTHAASGGRRGAAH